MAKYLSINALMLLVIFFGLFTASEVNAQIVAPNCNASLNYQWSYNSLNQSPCVVAAYLGQACDSNYQIPSINSTQQYGGPQVGGDDPCRCSSVLYILLSACGACQGGSFLSWSAYDHNCTKIYPTIFPEDIPAGTRVPKWAYQNVTAEDNFNPIEAQSVGDQPESTGTAKATGSSTGTTMTATSTPTSKKSHAGAIAGGVVGGLVVVCIAVIAVLYLRRRQRRRKPSNMIDIDDETKPRPYPIPASSSTFTGTGFHASVPTSSMPSSVAPKLYNPNDPSTFPSSVLSMSPSPPLQTVSGHSPQSSSETGATGYFSGYHSIQPNRQPGIPEI